MLSIVTKTFAVAVHNPPPLETVTEYVVVATGVGVIEAEDSKVFHKKLVAFVATAVKVFELPWHTCPAPVNESVN